jgi:hypothetical protein
LPAAARAASSHPTGTQAALTCHVRVRIVGNKKQRRATANFPCGESSFKSKSSSKGCYLKVKLDGKQVPAKTHCPTVPTSRRFSRPVCPDESTPIFDQAESIITCADDSPPECSNKGVLYKGVLYNGVLTLTSTNVPVCTPAGSDSDASDVQCLRNEDNTATAIVDPNTQAIMCLDFSTAPQYAAPYPSCLYHGVLGTTTRDTPTCYPDGTPPSETARGISLSAPELGTCYEGSIAGGGGYSEDGEPVCSNGFLPNERPTQPL